MARITLHTLDRRRASGEKIVCLTAYDSTHALLVSSQGCDVILVGDSLGNVVQGHDSTVPVTIDDMVYHTRCVARGNSDSLVMVDLPFMSFSTAEQACANAARLMQAGAEVVKLEGGRWLCPTIESLSERGVPTCVHLGLTPQSVSMLGGYRVQGRDSDSAGRLLEDARLLEQAGARLLLLECVPASLAATITAEVGVPVIGIGAGPDTDGQILVLYDLLGLTPSSPPRFVKNFMAQSATPAEAVGAYVAAVRKGLFPAVEHTFSQ